ncbi:MAG: hypothetical protein SAL70_17000 [Scytonema sp. PMC 1070.18]|nr:hypothetical protein [Scytonema sp. PMC 1070.18]
MMSQIRLKEMTDYLTQTLVGYEVIPANFGWHIHFENRYCGRLEYQYNKGWRGNALNHQPSLIIKQLKKFNPSDYSSYTTTTGGNLRSVA